MFNIRNPREVELKYSFKIQDNWAAGLGMALADERLYLAGDGGPMPIFDVSPSDSPKLLGQWEFGGGWVEDVMCGAERMLVINGGGDYFIFDIQDPVHPQRLVRTQSKGGEANLALAINDSEVLMAYKSKPAQVLDLSQSKQPAVIAQFKTRHPATSAVMTESHAFLGFRDEALGGIEVIDLSGDQRPRTVAVLELEHPVQDIAIGANRICAVHSNGSISIVDVSGRENLRLLGSYKPEQANGPEEQTILMAPRIAVSIKGDYFFLLNKYSSKKETSTIGYDVLEVVDLRNPAKPQLFSQLRIDRPDARESLMGYVGNFLILYAGEIIVVDVGDPSTPIIRTRQPIPPWQFGQGGIKLYIDNKYLYLGCFEDGIWIYRLPSYLRE